MLINVLAKLGFLVVAGWFAYSFVGMARDGEVRRACTPLCALRPHYANNNRLVPDFTLKDINGKSVSMSDFRGRSVVMNFWTKTCPPCLNELPALARVAKAMQHRDGLEFITICTDDTAEDAKDTLKSVLGELPSFVVLMDPESSVVADKFGTELYPETWFIDPNGVIRARVDGEREWTAALTMELAQSFLSAQTCPITFAGRVPSGPRASLCGESPSL